MLYPFPSSLSTSTEQQLTQSAVNLLQSCEEIFHGADLVRGSANIKYVNIKHGTSLSGSEGKGPTGMFELDWCPSDPECGVVVVAMPL